jgi:hypothetical protein
MEKVIDPNGKMNMDDIGKEEDKNDDDKTIVSIKNGELVKIKSNEVRDKIVQLWMRKESI